MHRDLIIGFNGSPCGRDTPALAPSRARERGSPDRRDDVLRRA